MVGGTAVPAVGPHVDGTAPTQHPIQGSPDAKGSAGPPANRKKRRNRGGTKARASNGGTTKEHGRNPKRQNSRSQARRSPPTLLRSGMKKTKLCLFFLENRCTRGIGCNFAHGTDELNDLPDLRKTRLCADFVEGKCDDADCKFAHGQDELRKSQFCLRRSLRKQNEGSCPLVQDRSDSDSEDGSCGTQKETAGRGAFQSRVMERRKRQRRLVRTRSDIDGPILHSNHMLCAGCGSTVATHLGMMMCPLCRHHVFYPDTTAG